MIQFADLFKECMSQFRETPEFSILSKHRMGGDCFSAQDRQAIIDSVERSFAPLFDQIRTDASSLTDTDLVFCVLSNLGVGATTIADCLTISPHTVRVRKHRMRDKLPASWYDFFYGEGTDEAAAGADEAVAEDKPKLPFVGQIAYCFRNYFNTKGRAGRSEYFCFFFLRRWCYLEFCIWKHCCTLYHLMSQEMLLMTPFCVAACYILDYYGWRHDSYDDCDGAQTS